MLKLLNSWLRIENILMQPVEMKINNQTLHLNAGRLRSAHFKGERENGTKVPLVHIFLCGCRCRPAMKNFAHMRRFGFFHIYLGLQWHFSRHAVFLPWLIWRWHLTSHFQCTKSLFSFYVIILYFHLCALGWMRGTHTHTQELRCAQGKNSKHHMYAARSLLCIDKRGIPLKAGILLSSVSRSFL